MLKPGSLCRTVQSFFFRFKEVFFFLPFLLCTHVINLFYDLYSSYKTYQILSTCRRLYILLYQYYQYMHWRKSSKNPLDVAEDTGDCLLMVLFFFLFRLKM